MIFGKSKKKDSSRNPSPDVQRSTAGTNTGDHSAQDSSGHTAPRRVAGHGAGSDAGAAQRSESRPIPKPWEAEGADSTANKVPHVPAARQHQPHGGQDHREPSGSNAARPGARYIAHGTATGNNAAQRARRRQFLTVGFVALLCGGVAAGGYSYVAPKGSTPLAPSAPTKKKDPAHQTTSFTDANQGDCIDWAPGRNGANTGFNRVDCAQPHRFEVAQREDLSKYPTSEFGPKAAQPNLQRQQQLTTELCNGPTLGYLKGKFDPEGRYSISPILPPQVSWEKGDRTMLCGVMVQDANGRSVETSGFAADQDQSRAFPADTCVRVDGGITNQVPCNSSHAWQVTSVINLAQEFPGAWPPVEAQNERLNEVCTTAARDYLGGDDALYYSTLTPFWTTIPQQSWDAGSHTVNCALTSGRAGGVFADLAGDVRHEFTIDGQPPVKPAPRQPLREQPAP